VKRASEEDEPVGWRRGAGSGRRRALEKMGGAFCESEWHEAK
jgi:hypothetical protein